MFKAFILVAILAFSACAGLSYTRTSKYKLLSANEFEVSCTFRLRESESDLHYEKVLRTYARYAETHCVGQLEPMTRKFDSVPTDRRGMRDLTVIATYACRGDGMITGRVKETRRITWLETACSKARTEARA